MASVFRWLDGERRASHDARQDIRAAADNASASQRSITGDGTLFTLGGNDHANALDLTSRLGLLMMATGCRVVRLGLGWRLIAMLLMALSRMLRLMFGLMLSFVFRHVFGLMRCRLRRHTLTSGLLESKNRRSMSIIIQETLTG